MKQTLLSQKSTIKSCILLLATTIICFILIALTKPICADEREHLYATFLTYSGNIPYRDFFEHHHPLLWYIGSLFLYINDNTHYIWYILRSFMICITLTSSFFIYKISKIQKLSTPFAILSSSIFLSLCAVKYAGLEYRPDNLMILFYTSGLYFLLCYLKSLTSQTSKPVLLNISITLFFLSFLTLQKAILILIPIFIFFILPNCNNKIFFKDFIKSLINPSLFLIFLISYLYKTNSLIDYFELNWLINAHIRMPNDYTIASIEKTLTEQIICIIATLFLFTKNPQYCKILSCYLLCSLIITISYFKLKMPIYEQYFLMFSPYNALIISFFISKLKTSPLFCNLSIIILSLIVLGSGIYKAYSYKQEPLNLQTHIGIDKIIYSNSKKTDSIICAIELSTVGGLRHCTQGYYFFSLGNLAPIHSYYFNGRELPKINTLIQTRKPKIVTNSGWADCKLNKINQKIECDNQEIDVLKMQQDYTNNGFIYIRKY
jgi:hypothetical protein